MVPYLAETQSIGGDQIGRVALSVLVFDRTGSTAWTALTYALTFLPAILGGVVLGGLGDRFSRVRVMVVIDLVRAALFLCVAIRGLPIVLVVALVSITFFLGPGFTAAMVSRMAAALSADRFRAASGIRMITSQAAQVAGFGVGGVIVAVVAPRAALVINAATFVVSAVLVGLALGRRGASPLPTPHGPGSEETAGLVATAAATEAVDTPDDTVSTSDVTVSASDTATDTVGAAPRSGRDPVPHLWRDHHLRELILLIALAGFFVVPEGLAVPVSRELAASDRVAGLLLAAGPLGSAIGAAVLVRFLREREGLVTARIMAIGCGVPLLATAALSDWRLIFLCWALSGALWAFQVDVVAALVHTVADNVRSRVIARASAVLLGVQGLGLIAFGGLGAAVGADRAVSLAGLLGVATALVIAATARNPQAVESVPGRQDA